MSNLSEQVQALLFSAFHPEVPEKEALASFKALRNMVARAYYFKQQQPPKSSTTGHKGHQPSVDAVTQAQVHAQAAQQMYAAQQRKVVWDRIFKSLSKGITTAMQDFLTGMAKPD